MKSVHCGKPLPRPIQAKYTRAVMVSWPESVGSLQQQQPQPQPHGVTQAVNMARLSAS